MEIQTIISAIIGLLALIATGGWFINYRQKKTIESASADNATLSASKNAVDLANEIAQKYNTIILSSMGEHEKRHDDVESKLDVLLYEVTIIGKYLNGGLAKFKKQQRDERGRFIKKK
ncbi:MAG: hypothetical protein LBS50_08735 [Prevotellaceae bacterium]|jgi:hypothetical protein|nr:hypothetical protein [Prevotellaceae bacterium]